MEQNNKVSFLIPCFNSEFFIKRGLNSIIAQSYDNWEAVCVDDKSTDTTLAILKEYEKKDSRIKVVIKGENGGNAAKTLNYGLTYVTGNFIVLLGHDDYVSSNFLVDILQKYDQTGADVIIPDCYLMNKDKSKNTYYIGSNYFNAFDEKKYDYSLILTGREACIKSLSWQIHAFACYKTSIIKENGFYEEGMNGDEFSSRVFFFSANKVAFSKGIYYYVQNPLSITKKRSVKRYDIFKAAYKLYSFLSANSFEKEYCDIIRNYYVTAYFNFVNSLKYDFKFFSYKERKAIRYILRDAYKNMPIKKLQKFKLSLLFLLWGKIGKKLRKWGIITINEE